MLESFLTQWGLAAVFLFGFLEACCVPIPSEITFGFAGVLAGQGKLNIAAVIIVGTLAELVGSMISYSIGRVGGRPLVHRFGRYLLITQRDIDRAERFFAGRGAWAVPLGRALPVVRTFVSIVAGFIEIPVMLFAVLSLIGTAIWVSVISLIGYGVGSAWHTVAHGISLAGYVIAVLAVALIVAFIVHRVRELRSENAAGVPGAQGLPGAHGSRGSHRRGQAGGPLGHPGGPQAYESGRPGNAFDQPGNAFDQPGDAAPRSPMP